LNFNRLQLSRLISRLDRLEPDDPQPQVEGGRAVGSAFRIGITGPLGAGKSSLINEIIRAFRKQGLTVGVIAVDPSSPFTGGALLGDRVRMADNAGDEGVFIRSLATRGAAGGLAAVAIDATDLLDQAGFDRIIIETVGVGQVEVDIVGACDLTVVVLEPSSGDMIQTMKAGLMEIADLFVVNKKDLRGFERYITDLDGALDMREWKRRPGVLATLARTGDGVAELVKWVEEWCEHARSDGSLEARRIEQRKERIRRAAEALLLKRLWETVSPEALERVAASEKSVRKAAQELVGGKSQ
jgi:LAO/AO transport system kinase